MDALTHIIKCSLGAGLLAVPLAFKNAGLLFGTIGTIVIGFVCTHCVQILVSHMTHKRCIYVKIN